MFTCHRTVALLLTLTLWPIAFGQDPSQSVDAFRLSGRIVDPAGLPIAGTKVNLRDGTNNESRTATTDQHGGFALSAASRSRYTWNFELAGIGNADLAIHTADLMAMDLGDIVVDLSDSQEPSVVVSDPVQLQNRSDDASGRGAARGAAGAIAAVYCSNGGGIHVVHNDGKQIQLLKEEPRLSCQAALISEDRRTAGLLVLSDFCCTSYPIALKIVIYRPGKPLRNFNGDGRAIFDWRFLAAAKQVAFYQDFLHGPSAPHYELRDIETGRLLGSWDGALTRNAPLWTRGPQW